MGLEGGGCLSDPGVPTIAHRPLPAALERLSALTILVDPPAVATPSADARTLVLLQRARDLGVSSVDVATASNPERAERLIARAFPEPDSGVIAVVGRSVDSLSRERTATGDTLSGRLLGDALAESLERSRRRLAPVPVGVVEWAPATDEEDPTLPDVPDDSPSRSGSSKPVWALRLSHREVTLPDYGHPLNLFSGPFSILDPDLGTRFEEPGTSQKSFLIARDPFCGGRLDGSRFAARTALAGPTSPPVDLRRLHVEFDPVLRLGFLTSGHRRTLAQAALRFVLRWPWVASVVVPLPEPERFDEVFGYGTTPPISPDELERIRLLK